MFNMVNQGEWQVASCRIAEAGIVRVRRFEIGVRRFKIFGEVQTATNMTSSGVGTRHRRSPLEKPDIRWRTEQAKIQAKACDEWKLRVRQKSSVQEDSLFGSRTLASHSLVQRGVSGRTGDGSRAHPKPEAWVLIIQGPFAI